MIGPVGACARLMLATVLTSKTVGACGVRLHARLTDAGRVNVRATSLDWIGFRLHRFSVSLVFAVIGFRRHWFSWSLVFVIGRKMTGS